MPLSPRAAHRKDLSGKPATMTHQHFRSIAESIRKLATHPSSELARDLVAFRFADDLARTNPNFNRVRFLAACGVTGAE